MGSDNRISIIIAAKDAASDVVEGVLGSLGDLGDIGVKALEALAGAAVAVGSALFELAREAAPIANLRSAFNQLASKVSGGSAQMLANLKKASAGMIDQADLMRIYNDAALQLGDTMANRLPEAMTYLRRIAGATGQDLTDMTNAFTEGIDRLSPRMLNQLGITLDLNQVYSDYAATLGIGADQLTKQQQQTALFNAVMQDLQTTAGGLPDVVGTAQQAWGQFVADISDAKDQIGEAFLPVFQQAVGGLDSWLKANLPGIVSFIRDTLVPGIQLIAGEIEVWWNVIVLYFNYYASQIADVINTYFGQDIQNLVDMFRTGDFSKLPKLVADLLGNISRLFWDNLATPIGKALSSITPDQFTAIALGVVLIAGALLIANIPTLVANITGAFATLITLLGAPLLGVIALIIVMLVAWSNNWLGLKDRANEFGETLQKGAKAWYQLINIIGIVLVNALKDAYKWVVNLISQIDLALSKIPLIGQVFTGSQITNPTPGTLTIGSKDSGGLGLAGHAYMIGTGAQPEVFVPSTSGTFIPNADKLMGATGNNLQVIFNGGPGAPRNDQEADDSARMIVGALRARGIQI